jgi:hypothetical protein
MTMTGRFVDHGIRILAAVALLLAVMSPPIRPTGACHTAPSPNYLPRNFANLKIGHCGPIAMSARPSFIEQDELTVTPPPASTSFDVLASPCPEPHSERVSFAVALAARPLRC